MIFNWYLVIWGIMLHDSVFHLNFLFYLASYITALVEKDVGAALLQLLESRSPISHLACTDTQGVMACYCWSGVTALVLWASTENFPASRGRRASLLFALMTSTDTILMETGNRSLGYSMVSPNSAGRKGPCYYLKKWKSWLPTQFLLNKPSDNIEAPPLGPGKVKSRLLAVFGSMDGVEPSFFFCVVCQELSSYCIKYAALFLVLWQKREDFFIWWFFFIYLFVCFLPVVIYRLTQKQKNKNSGNSPPCHCLGSKVPSP